MFWREDNQVLGFLLPPSGGENVYDLTRSIAETLFMCRHIYIRFLLVALFFVCIVFILQILLYFCLCVLSPEKRLDIIVPNISTYKTIDLFRCVSALTHKYPFLMF